MPKDDLVTTSIRIPKHLKDKMKKTGYPWGRQSTICSEALQKDLIDWMEIVKDNLNGHKEKQELEKKACKALKIKPFNPSNFRVWHHWRTRLAVDMDTLKVMVEAYKKGGDKIFEEMK